MKPKRFLPKILRGIECLNCGLPLHGEENFCPNCGQRNDIRKLNFGNFLGAVFDEFISYDSRFWRTIVVLLLKPGKVSKDYIEGKRAQYANPFRFYLTISIIFFLLLGLFNKYEDFNKKDINSAQILKIDGLKKQDLKPIVDSIVKVKSTTNSFHAIIDSISESNKLSSVPKKIARFGKFYINHPHLSVNIALDSLNQPHNFWNRFYYSKVIEAVEIANDHGKSLNKKIVSNLSIALFVFLPLFALFLKLFYVRRHFNYMEHLVFVFNTQSVFFILMMLVTGLNFYSKNPSIIAIFVVLFLIYLYMALLKFYSQAWFKTFIKFSIFNMIYLTLSGIGLAIVSILAFLVG